jgi:hypothetical protein
MGANEMEDLFDELVQILSYELEMMGAGSYPSFLMTSKGQRLGIDNDLIGFTLKS